VEIFSHELAELYGAYRRGEDSPLPPLEIQYADYALGKGNGCRMERRQSSWTIGENAFVGRRRCLTCLRTSRGRRN